jgi:hypothetical protein
MHPRLKPTVRCLNKRSFARASGVKNRTWAPCVAIGDLGQNGSADQAHNMGNIFPARFLKWAKRAWTIKLEVERPTSAVTCYDVLRPFSMSATVERGPQFH